jgi:hypothetical protein
MQPVAERLIEFDLGDGRGRSMSRACCAAAVGDRGCDADCEALVVPSVAFQEPFPASRLPVTDPGSCFWILSVTLASPRPSRSPATHRTIQIQVGAPVTAAAATSTMSNGNESRI